MNILALKDDPNVEVKFVAGRDFQSHIREHKLGEEVPEAWDFHNLEVLVRTGFLYPWVGDVEYTWLPPHVFHAVMNREEVEAELDKPTGPRTAAAEVAAMKAAEEAPAKKAAAPKAKKA